MGAVDREPGFRSCQWYRFMKTGMVMTTVQKKKGEKKVEKKMVLTGPDENGFYQYWGDPANDAFRAELGESLFPSPLQDDKLLQFSGEECVSSKLTKSKVHVLRVERIPLDVGKDKDEAPFGAVFQVCKAPSADK